MKTIMLDGSYFGRLGVVSVNANKLFDVMERESAELGCPISRDKLDMFRPTTSALIYAVVRNHPELIEEDTQ